MTNLLAQADQVLRGRPGEIHAGRTTRTLRELLTFTIIGGVLYGAAMGTFGGLAGDRIWQIAYSASKVPLLLLATFAISLPSFFVLNSLLGVRQDFAQVLRALTAAQAALTIVLTALAPYTLFWYRCSADYQVAILFNALLFALATVAAQWLLRRYYAPLIRRNRRHRLLLRVWLVMYAFVGIQMGWVLRPFIGAPTMPAQFLRQEAWGNAYVVVARMIWELVTQ